MYIWRDCGRRFVGIVSVSVEGGDRSELGESPMEGRGGEGRVQIWF